ncbi:MAG: T9SS type A sorting domain-containing protein [Chitinophagaceae bacterium]|nr:T9SS type A sorting domain-containing protein [Chitinophagaceae bacterium]
MGAYLDDGKINGLSTTPGSEITTIIPQVYTDSIIKDTLNWTKIEGSFLATGNENYISIGLFFNNSAISKILTNYCSASTQYSAYLIDDVSVIPIDLAADAGKDTWVEVGKQVQIGRVGDTTAEGLDCKWYHKGTLIDSGAIITVNAASSINQIDTYVVVQNVCGNITRDTMLLKTVGLGIPLLGGVRGGFTIYPNPSTGVITISPHTVIPQESIHATLYDLLGRVVHQQKLSFNNKEAVLKLHLPSATYILELSNEEGTVQRERVVIK